MLKRERYEVGSSGDVVLYDRLMWTAGSFSFALRVKVQKKGMGWASVNVYGMMVVWLLCIRMI
jgi:hypothetical protein